MKISINTIGCKFNQVESAEMRGMLEEHGFDVVSSSNNNADVYIINTCTVTGKSDYRSRQAIRRAAKINKNAFIIATGCYAQMNKEETALLDNVNIVLGNDKKLDIIKHLKNIKKSAGKAIIDVGDIDNEKRVRSYTFKNYLNYSRAFIKIQAGCNNKCSYCIAAKARGKSRSSHPEEVERQIKLSIDRGFREIVLTGIHIGSYGYDLTEKTNISELLKRLIEIDGLKRIRLSSISPTEISDELISLIGSSDKVCSHLHIPFQSGDDKILKMMRRDYDSYFFKDLIAKLESCIPEIAIGLDVMVGFPGESEKNFNNTFNLIDNLPISYMHVFRFSKRKGTEAYNLDCQIKESVKKERSILLKSLSKKKLLTFRKDQIGRIKNIIIESKRDTKTGLLKGLTDNYIPVLINGSDDLMDRFIQVRINDVKDEKVFGEVFPANCCTPLSKYGYTL